MTPRKPSSATIDWSKSIKRGSRSYTGSGDGVARCRWCEQEPKAGKSLKCRCASSPRCYVCSRPVMFCRCTYGHGGVRIVTMPGEN